jgi:predicted Zn-dependent protease
VRDRTFIHPALGVGFTVPDGFVIDNTSDAVLATGTDGTALRFDAVALSQGANLAEYLASGWVNGLIEGSAKTFTVNGMPAASASASAKGWQFRIAVVQASSGATYRFIFANEAATPGLEHAVTETVKTFRMLDQATLSGLKPLRVHLVAVQAGDTEDTLARRMRGVERPRDLFRILNGLDAGVVLAPGMMVKYVAE